MGFQETRSDISICNRALSRIGQVGLVGSLSDPANLNKTAGRECNLHYKPTVRRLLEQHHWNMATKRVALVASTNTRTLEWPYSYAAPSDMGFPVAIQPYEASAGAISYYRGIGALIAKLYGQPYFTFSAGVVYSMQSDAEIEYISFNISEQEFTQDFEDVLVLFLASRLAYSIAKDAALGNSIKQEALAELNMVLANNLNQQQPRYDLRPSEAELARAGVDPWMQGYGGWRV